MGCIDAGEFGHAHRGIGAATKVQVETAADGSGTVIPRPEIRVWAIQLQDMLSRDAGGNFIATVAAAGWSLASRKTDSVADGDLVAAGDNKSATYTGNLVGGAEIHVTSGG